MPHGHAIKQTRSFKTYQSLVETGFKLLEELDLDQIQVSQIASEAGYSVGAFYARFESKNQFFEALIHYHLEKRSKDLSELYKNTTIHDIPEVLVKNITTYYTQHRRFWRAVQIQNNRDELFAKRFRANFAARRKMLVDYLEEKLNRSLSKKENDQVAFSLQVLLGTVNNAAFNESGPIQLNQKNFLDEMKRAFILISSFYKFIEEYNLTSKAN